jgi:sacsin
VAASRDWPLIWSEMPTVPPDLHPPSAASAFLRVRSPPPLSAVLSHVRQVAARGAEDLLGSWPATAGPVEEATAKLLDHLQKEGLNRQQGEEVGSLAFVPVANATQLASASQVRPTSRPSTLTRSYCPP